MIIDRKNNAWIVVALLLLVVAGIIYVPEARSLRGPSGGSTRGLILGGLGSAMILFAILLSLRKKLPTLRIGRSYFWMQGHVWLGLISYPIILLHAGFSWGGTLTQVLMWLFTIIVISGVFGLILQNIIPTRMFHDLPMETIYEQIDHVLAQVRQGAEDLMRSITSAPREQMPFALEAIDSGSAVAAAPATEPGVELLRSFYSGSVRPFLFDEPAADPALADKTGGRSAFDHVRKLLPSRLHGPLTELQEAVEERRQLAQQKRLHHWLHGWLFIHVPLSFAMIILAIVHAVMAIRY